MNVMRTLLPVAVAALGFLIGETVGWRDAARGSSAELFWGHAGRSPPASVSTEERADDASASPDANQERLPQDEVATPEPVATAPKSSGPTRRLGIPTRPEVSRYVRFFSTSSQGRSLMVAWLRRASGYSELFRETLDKYRLPEQLMAVAFVESGLNPSAVSPVGATGLWQFMPETARAYDLQVLDEVDERRDPTLSTDAAARHLRDLYLEFEDWPLALAAYNAGVSRVRDAISRTGSDDFWAIARSPDGLPLETVSYVPKVFAVAKLLGDLSAYGLPPVSPEEQTEEIAQVTVPRPVSMTEVAASVGLSVSALRELNPSLVDGQLPFSGTGYTVSIPARNLRLAELLLLPEVESSLRTKLQREVDRLAAGAPQLRRPSGCVVEPCAPNASDEKWDKLFRAVGGVGAPRTYVVRSGDTPHKVAELFGVDAEALMSDNGVSDARSIRVGQLLILPPAPTQL
jgi:membrane-bound lytic murein transglycosylase D